MVFLLASLMIAGAFLLGGGTHSGFLSDVWLQLLAIPLLLAGFWAAPKKHYWLLAALALLVVPVIDLPEIASSSYWNGSFAGGVELDNPSVLSLTPQAGWAALVSLLPIIAVFLAVSQLHARQRVHLTLAIVILGGISAVMGFLQVAQGPESPLRFYEFTNRSEAVGFFANRNHFAALLYVTLLLVAPWLILTSGEALSRASLRSSSILQFAAIGAFLLLVIAGLALARSRAGIFLAMAAVLGVGLVVWSARRRESAGGGTSRIVTLGLLGFATLFAVQFGFHRLQSRFERDPLEDLRVPFNTTTYEALLANLPLGTGLGSFVPVYAIYEKTADQFTGFANRAHNDVLEFALETGVIGILLMALFATWFVGRVVMVWWKTDANLRPIDIMLQRVSALCVALLIAHSLVDYPLRTTALGTVFAFCCAMLLPPPVAAHPEAKATAGRARVEPQPSEPQPRNSEPTVPPRKLQSLAHMDWPVEWQTGDEAAQKKGDSD